MTDHAWIAPVVLVGLWVLSGLWTLVTAPGLRVKDQHVLITGATKGLGLALAKRYAKAGARLTLVGRSQERLETARREIEEAVGANTEIFLAEADITDYEQAAHMIAQANEFHSRPTDHIVCAARVAVRSCLMDTELSVLRAAMDLNYMAVINVVKNALPPMIEAGVRGRVVLVSSTDAFHATSDSLLATSTDQAIKGLAETLRNELLLYGMSTHIFYPGSIRSNASEPAVPSKGDAPSTPVPDNSVADYATFHDCNSSASGAHFDKLARTLTGGVSMGYVTITNGVMGFVLRGLSNGVVPRKNSPFELMIMPLCMIVGCFASAFAKEPSQSQKESAVARALASSA